MSPKRTFLDTGVLIAAALRTEETALQALQILDDPDREFVSSIFVKLEVLPKTIYSRFFRHATATRPHANGHVPVGGAQARPVVSCEVQDKLFSLAWLYCIERLH